MVNRIGLGRSQSSPSHPLPPPAPQSAQEARQAAEAFRLQSLTEATLAADLAYSRYVSARQRLVVPKNTVAYPVTRLTSALMCPSLRDSLVRAMTQRATSPTVAQHALQRAKRGQAYLKHVVTDLSQACNQAIRRQVDVKDLFAARPPPRRVADLVGGVHAWLALPEWAGTSPQRKVRLTTLKAQDLPGPVVRGIDDADRLFLAVAYRRDTREAPWGIVVLAECAAQSGTGWMTYNPQRFVPPKRSGMGGAFAPMFFAMESDRKIPGGPDAQALLEALGALIRDGHIPGYRLAHAQALAEPQR